MDLRDAEKSRLRLLNMLEKNELTIERKALIKVFDSKYIEIEPKNFKPRLEPWFRSFLLEASVEVYYEGDLVKFSFTLRDIFPEDDKFWVTLNECSKCGGATQPDWDKCPLCGEKLKKKV